MKHIILPDSGKRHLAFYLAMEQFVADKIDDDAFFVWRVDPTVIIGRNQVLENEVNIEYCQCHGISVVRRKSGGGCVYSDDGNIMISSISRRGNASDIFESYLSQMVEALNSIGLPAERSGRNDILIEGRKVSGNAFRQLPTRSVVHGTLLYSSDLDALERAVKPPVEKLQRHGVASVRQRVMNIQEYIEGKSDIHVALQSVQTLESFLTERFCDGEIMLTEAEVNAIERLASEYQLE